MSDKTLFKAAVIDIRSRIKAQTVDDVASVANGDRSRRAMCPGTQFFRNTGNIDPYAEGWDAAKDGEQKDACKYIAGSPEHHLWLKGWISYFNWGA